MTDQQQPPQAPYPVPVAFQILDGGLDYYGNPKRLGVLYSNLGTIIHSYDVGYLGQTLSIKKALEEIGHDALCPKSLLKLPKLLVVESEFNFYANHSLYHNRMRNEEA